MLKGMLENRFLNYVFFYDYNYIRVIARSDGTEFTKLL